VRVLYLNPFSQEVSGPDESLLALLAQLIPRGVEAHLVLPALGPQVPRYQAELRETLRAEGTIYQTIRESGDLSDETTAKLDEALQKFVDGFNIEEERGLVG